MKFYGIGAAIYGGNTMRLSSTILAGEKRDKIYILDTKSEPLDLESPAELKEVFADFLARIQRTVIAQREEIRVAIPVVFGWPTEMTENKLSAVFNHVSARRVAKSKVQLSGLDVHTEYRELLREIIKDFLTSVDISESDISYCHRGFLDTTREYSPIELQKLIEASTDKAWEQKIALLKARSTYPSSSEKKLAGRGPGICQTVCHQITPRE